MLNEYNIPLYNMIHYYNIIHHTNCQHIIKILVMMSKKQVYRRI